MSLILEALNKADRKREEIPAVPDLNSVHGPDTTMIQSQNRRPIWLVAGLLVVIVLILLVLLLNAFFSKGESAPAPASSAPVITPSAATREIPPPPLNTSAPKLRLVAKTKTKTAAVDPAIQALYAEAEKVKVEKGKEEAGSQARAVAETSSAGSSAATSPESEVEEALLRSLLAEVQKEMPGNYEQRIESFNQAQMNGAQVLNSGPGISQNQASFLHELDVTIQNRIPSIMYSNHIYSDKGSAVILNGKMLKSGDTSEQGLFVEDILSDGVVLKYGDLLFKLGELSSWVNMQ